MAIFEIFMLEHMDNIRAAENESRFTLSLIIIFHGMGMVVTNCLKTIMSPHNIARSLAYKMELLGLPKYHRREISDELVADYYRRIGGPEGLTPIIEYFLYFPIAVVLAILIAPWMLTLEQFKIFFSYAVFFASIVFLGFVLLAETYS